MTDKTAKEIFDVLLYELKANNFNDIGTFLLPEVSKEDEYEEFSEKYQYSSSELALQELEILSNNPQGANIALRMLLRASEEYFTLASSIPRRFKQEMLVLNGENDTKIVMQTINENEVNIEEQLDNKNVIEFLQLIQLVRKNLSENVGDDFLNEIQ